MNEIAYHFGIVKWIKSETEYILTNINEYLDALVSEKKEAIFKKKSKNEKRYTFQKYVQKFFRYGDLLGVH